MTTSTQYARQVQSSTILLVITLCVVTVGPVATAGAVAVADDRPTADPGSADLSRMAGSGTAQDPYEISNATDLRAMSDDLDAHYVLVDDVDASGTESWDAGSGFDPVGDRDSAFTGTFDGQNHTIRGLAVRRSGDDWTGLFGRVGADGRVEHVRLIDASVQGNNIVGALAGQVDGEVRDVAVSGSVEGQNFVGGLAGKLGEGGTVTRSSANAAVDGSTFLGGFAGESTGASVSAASATGDVSGSENVGGFVGSLTDGGLRDVYAAGSVSGSNRVGGLVGHMKETALNGAYSTGSVDGESQVGGVAGSSDGDISDVYWNADVAGTDVAVERDRSSAGFDTTELTTAEMTGQSASANMGDLDASAFWAPTDEYPVLQSQVDAVSLSTADRILVGQPSTVSASAALADGRTVPVTNTAEYGSNESFLSVDAGVVEASDNGTAELTATVGDTAATAVLEVLTPPDISVNSASLPYDRVGTDVAAPVRAVLENDGGATGTFEVNYRVDGETVESRTVSVEGYTERTETFDWTAGGTGEYEITVNDTEIGILTVVEEPETGVASASVDAETVPEGESATVTATLDNAGDAAGSHEVELTADGDVVASRTVVVPADGRTVSFDWTADGTGEHDLAVGGASAGTVTVAEVGTVSVGSVEAPASVAPGESYELAVPLANDGGVELSTNFTYSIGGETVSSRTVSVPADGTTVTLEHAVDDGGSVEHAVAVDDDEWSGTTQVAADASTATPEADGSDDGGSSDGASSGGGDGDSSDDGGDGDGSDGDDGGSADGTTADDGPGFGVAATLCALLAVVALRRRSG